MSVGFDASPLAKYARCANSKTSSTMSARLWHFRARHLAFWYYEPPDRWFQSFEDFATKRGMTDLTSRLRKCNNPGLGECLAF